jgi:hypothetical protein
MVRRLCWLLTCLMFAALPVLAQQGSSGELTGTVVDASGAVIPGALVVATETATNVSSKTTSSSAGVYTFPTLQPGTYNIVASRDGFQTEQVQGVTLRVAQLLRLNVKLQVGGSSETVTVTAQDLLESASSQIDHYVTSQEIETEPIPVTGDGERQLQDFIFKTLPGTNGETYLGSINGGQWFSNEIYIDGISMGTFDTAEMGPSMEAAGEFNMQTGSMGAQYDGGGTAVSNFNMQSGTNQFHGSVYEYLQNEDLNANSWDANFEGTPRPKQRMNNFGGSFGGPVWIPKLYNGHNKTFFFFTYDQTIKNNFVLEGQTSMPTQAMLNGDLSGFLNPAESGDSLSGQPAPATDILGRPVIYGQIYDPNTTRVLNQGQVDPVTGLTAQSAGVVRTPFPNNQIPTSRFDSVAQAYLKLPFPTNLIPGKVYNNIETYASNQPVFSQHVYNAKVDQQFGQAHKVSLFLSLINRDRAQSGNSTWSVPGTNPLDTWDWQHNPGKVARISEYWSISPHLSNHFGIGFNSFVNTYHTSWSNENWPQTLGLQNLPAIGFPTLSFSAANNALGSEDTFGNSANGGGSIFRNLMFTDQVALTHGRHDMQFGAEGRYYYGITVNTPEQPNFAFANTDTDDGTATTKYSGNAFASFLLGQVSSTGRGVPVGNYDEERKEFAVYFQDNWKLNNKLALNFGLRWVGMGGLTDAHGYITNLCLTCANTAASNLPGALQFASQMGKKGFENGDWGIFLPRFGFAWQPYRNWVWRGGFGINTQSPEGSPLLMGNYTGGPSTLGYTGAIAANQGTNPQPYSDMAPFILSQPYPAFTGSLPDYDPTQANYQYGVGVPYHIVTNGSNPAHTANYTFGFQWSLGRQYVLEANYVGNTTRGIYAYGMDQLNDLPFSDVATYGNALGDPIAQHPNIPLPYASFNSNWSVMQALAPYPQYGGGGIYQLDSHYGWSRFDSLQATLTRHVSKGLNVLVAYTWSKLMTNANGNFLGNIQDVYHPKLEKALAADLDVPQQIKITAFYDLPFGRGRRFSMPIWLDTVAGGWTLSGNAIYQSGDVLSVTDDDVSSPTFEATRPDFTGIPLMLKKSYAINYNCSASSTTNCGPQYLNPAAFTDPPNTGAPYYFMQRPGNVPSALGNIVGPGLFDENFSLQKNFRFGEGRYFQFRADAINAFNRAGLGNPYTAYYAGAPFGQILNPGTDSQSMDSDSYFYQPRVVQVAGRIRF